MVHLLCWEQFRWSKRGAKRATSRPTAWGSTLPHSAFVCPYILILYLENDIESRL
jgi:hypothetical protein